MWRYLILVQNITYEHYHLLAYFQAKNRLLIGSKAKQTIIIYKSMQAWRTYESPSSARSSALSRSCSIITSLRATWRSDTHVIHAVHNRQTCITMSGANKLRPHNLSLSQWMNCKIIGRHNNALKERGGGKSVQLLLPKDAANESLC